MNSLNDGYERSFDVMRDLQNSLPYLAPGMMTTGLKSKRRRPHVTVSICRTPTVLGCFSQWARTPPGATIVNAIDDTASKQQVFLIHSAMRAILESLLRTMRPHTLHCHESHLFCIHAL